jgi:uncharacterized membrane protein YedE/YeeE
MTALATFVSGIIFGLGLVVSGLINPSKVIGFLDLVGSWDPSLAITMVVAALVTGVGYRLTFRRGAPWLSAKFKLPQATKADTRLITGAGIFGIGWGLAGFCPGPALAAAALGYVPALIFTASMIVGMVAARWIIKFDQLAVVCSRPRFRI